MSLLLRSAIVSALLKSPHGYSVSTLSREGSSYSPPAGVTGLKSDYTHGSLVQALKGQDVVVSAIAGAAVPEQTKVIDAAIEAGVKRTLKTDFLGFDIANKTTTFWDERYKNVPFSTSRLPLLADAISQSLAPTISPNTANRVLAIRDVTVTFAEILNALETATGSAWPLNHADLDQLFEESKAKAARGDASGVSHMIVRNILDVESEGDFDERGIVSNELVGVEGWELLRIVDAVVAEVQDKKTVKHWDHNSARDVVCSNHGINYPNQAWITMQMTYVVGQQRTGGLDGNKPPRLSSKSNFEIPRVA
ncbi:isoflavone reductase [Histoplasma capsulatum H143]|uniref:Isoflavone reductase n=1 Tax=Ajellomyces capsulatus (strain H143) TaxID=544712 RepID=C6H4W6_AJECH|nr:isoflavone reductase [Histoplasma capsulatum H143]